MTTRREVLRQCLLIAVGAAMLPACTGNGKKPALVLKNFQLEADEQLLLAEVSETILPATNTPGAKDVLVPAFVLTMLDDLYTKQEQQQFLQGMRDFAGLARRRFGNSFLEADAKQRTELVGAILQGTGGDPTTAFVQTMKKLTVQGYTTCREYLTKLRVYELVPGRFHGCAPVEAALRSPRRDRTEVGRMKANRGEGRS